MDRYYTLFLYGLTICERIALEIPQCLVVNAVEIGNRQIKDGCPTWTRTRNQVINSHLLYH